MPTQRNLGDALRADKIFASAREISKVYYYKRTSKHRGQYVQLRGDVYCVIEIPLKQVADKK